MHYGKPCVLVSYGRVNDHVAGIKHGKNTVADVYREDDETWDDFWVRAQQVTAWINEGMARKVKNES